MTNIVKAFATGRHNLDMLTCAAIAALDRASSLFPCVSAVELSPNVRPGVFFQLALAGTEARGVAV